VLYIKAILGDKAKNDKIDILLSHTNTIKKVAYTLVEPFFIKKKLLCTKHL